MADVKKPVGTFTLRSPIDGAVDIYQAPKTEAQITDEAVEITAVTGADYRETHDSVAQGRSSVQSEASTVAQNNIQSSVDTAVRSVDIPADQAAISLDQALEKSTTVGELRSNLIEGAASMNSDLYSPMQQKVLLRSHQALDIINDVFKGTEDRGMFKSALAWIERELILYPVNNMVDDALLGKASEGKEIIAAAMSMSEEEFGVFMREKAQAKFDEGILFEGTSGAKDRITGAVTDRGAVTEADKVTSLFAIVEGVTIAFPAAKVAGKGVAKGANVLIHGRAPVSRAGSVAGHEAADEVAGNLMKSEAVDVPHVREDLQPDTTNLVRGTTGTKGPTQAQITARLDENVLVQQIKKQAAIKIAQGPSDELVGVAISRVTAAIRKDITRPLINTRVINRGGLDDNAIEFSFGKMKDGAPFSGTTAGKNSAQKFANQINDRGTTGGKTSSARVVEVEAGNPKSGYMVQVEAPVDLRTAYDAIKLDEVSNSGLKNFFLSTRSTTDAASDAAASTAMSSKGTYQKMAAELMKPYNKLRGKSKGVIDDILADLRDGPDAYIRNSYSKSDFEQKFADKHPEGRYPTDDEYKAWLAVQDLNDANYFLKSNQIRTKLENKGFKAIDIAGGSRVARKVDASELADDTQLISGRTGTRISKEGLLEEIDVWELMDDIEGIKHVYSPKKVRLLDNTDVLSYNAGGPRTNPNARYFVAEGDNDGRAFFSAFSENQARKGSAQLEAIFSKARAFNKPIDELVDELDDVIAKNNSWNPSITNTADFLRIAKDKGWDVSKKVSYKARDQKVQDVDRSPFGGMTQSEMHTMVRARNDDVLMEYGGAQAFNEKPAKTIADAYDVATGELSMRYYNLQAKTGFLKHIFGELPQGADIEMLYRQEVRRIQDISPTSRTDKERRLMTIADTVSRREGVEGPVSAALSNTRRQLENFIFDKSISWKLDPNGWRVAIPKPENLLLQMGFRSAFALNFSQLVLQSSQMMIISAISPTSGLKGAASSIPFRAVMNSGEASAKKLGYERLAKFARMDVETLEAAEYYMRHSGRDVIENDTVFNGTGGDSTITSLGQSKAAQYAKAADKLAMKPFTEGEKLARYTAVLTASDEYARKFGTKTLTSQDAMAWIARREQDLTLNMTNASRGGAQAGLGAVPTQWMTFVRNAAEAVFVGRGFTKGERARMALGFLALSGTGTLPFGSDDKVEEGLAAAGVEGNSGIHTLVTQGVIDWMLTELIQGVTGDEDAGTNLSNRLSLFGGIADLGQKANENVLQFILGPSGQIVGPALATAWNIASGVAQVGTGGGEYTWEFFKRDLGRIPRTISGVDSVIKGYGMYNNGVYVSKDGVTSPLEFSPAEAVIQMMGIQPDNLGEWNEARNASFGTYQTFQATRKEVTQRMNQTVAIMQSDPDAAMENLGAIDAIISNSDLTRVQKDELRTELMKGKYEVTLTDLFDYYKGMGKDALAENLLNLD